MSQNNQAIELRAAEWAVRLHARAFTAEEQVELDGWLAADARHQGALLRARAAWVDLDRLAALAGGHGRSRAALRSNPVSRSIPRLRVAAAGIAVLTCLSAGAWWLQSRSGAYISEVGEIRHVALPDGSHMTLDSATEARVHFDNTQREVELATGEGLFQVAKDPNRPFIVRAGSVSVRAVGTVFSVRTVDQRVDVVVTEGVVELSDGNGMSDNTVRRVKANERATVMDTRQIDVQSLPATEAERQLAWRNGMLDFTGEALSDAIAEMNRHNRRHIIVDDTVLAIRPVVGLFRADDPDGFAATVAIALGAHIVNQDDAVHLRLGSNP